MKIQKLTIQNYRNFKNFEIELKPFTLIIGENNIGKTNLLNAIGLIFSQEITFFKKRMLEIDDINYDAIVNFKNEVLSGIPIADIKPPEVIIEAILDDLTAEQKNVVADWFIGENFDKARLTYKFYPKTDLSKWIQEIRDSLNDESTID